MKLPLGLHGSEMLIHILWRALKSMMMYLRLNSQHSVLLKRIRDRPLNFWKRYIPYFYILVIVRCYINIVLPTTLIFCISSPNGNFVLFLYVVLIKRQVNRFFFQIKYSIRLCFYTVEWKKTWISIIFLVYRFYTIGCSFRKNISSRRITRLSIKTAISM